MLPAGRGCAAPSPSAGRGILSRRAKRGSSGTGSKEGREDDASGRPRLRRVPTIGNNPRRSGSCRPGLNSGSCRPRPPTSPRHRLPDSRRGPAETRAETHGRHLPGQNLAPPRPLPESPSVRPERRQGAVAGSSRHASSAEGPCPAPWRSGSLGRRSAPGCHPRR